MSATPHSPLPAFPPPIVAAFLSYLVPGLGQIMQRRFGKGLLFMVCLLSMFFLGQAMGAWRNVYIPTYPTAKGPITIANNKGIQMLNAICTFRWHYAGQFCIGVAAWPALAQYFELPLPEGEFWHNFQRGPMNATEEGDINTFYVNNDKTPDLGWVYTVIAGMLNLLVIYDAFAGAAFPTLARSPEIARPKEMPA